MLLRDILRTFRDEASAKEYLLTLGDLSLVARLQDLASAQEVNLGEFIANAVNRYASVASDEEWLTLLGLISRTEDPATACLQRALQYTVAAAGKGVSDGPHA